MKIATWNINSVRRRLDLVLDWLNCHQPDVLCLQETKVEDHLFPALAFQSAGYHATFRGMKGYNGVATLSRSEPTFILHGFHEGPDNEDVRVLQTVVDGIPILNTYAPQGWKVPSDKYAAKLEWFLRMKRYFHERLDASKPAIWTGDLNVAPEALDVYHPERRINDPDFHIDAREAYKNTLAWGWVDTFRRLYPERVQYTYWDYFRNAFDHNWGWRIDHILATAPLAERCKTVDVDLEPRKSPDASDHTVLWAEFES